MAADRAFLAARSHSSNSNRRSGTFLSKKKEPFAVQKKILACPTFLLGLFPHLLPPSSLHSQNKKNISPYQITSQLGIPLLGLGSEPEPCFTTW
jgi:hypothetical protein